MSLEAIRNCLVEQRKILVEYVNGASKVCLMLGQERQPTWTWAKNDTCEATLELGPGGVESILDAADPCLLSMSLEAIRLVEQRQSLVKYVNGASKVCLVFGQER